MKILYLNITVGCKEAGRFKRLVNFVAKQNPDILGLSELNGWERDNFAKLNRFKEKTNLKFSLFCRSPHGYHIGLFSNTPLRKKYVSRRGLWHGIIIATARTNSKTYTFALTHLSPISEEHRLNDLKHIFAKLKLAGRTILLGDMNSISPQDAIDDDSIFRKARRLRIKKFGSDKIEKRVISTILRRGLLDTAHLSKRKFNAYSIPTKYVHDPKHFARLHLDYIFVARDLAKSVKTAGVLRNKETDRLSDHYPVFALLKD